MKNEQRDMKNVENDQNSFKKCAGFGFHVFHGVFAYKKRFSASVSSLFHATSFDSFLWKTQIRNFWTFFAAECGAKRMHMKTGLEPNWMALVAMEAM